MYRFIAVDPGKGGKRPSIGVACWNAEIEICYMQQLFKDEFDRFLDNLEEIQAQPEALIYEKYSINPRVGHGGSEAHTIQLIGQLKDFCRRRKIPNHGQPSSILKVAQKWSGVNMPKNHTKSDHISAYLHGYYWLTVNKFIVPRVMERKSGE